MGMTNLVKRSKGDPKVLESGPSSLTPGDRVARSLGWFSIGLGLAELLYARSVTRALGVEGSEPLVRAFGAREIGSGVLSLSVDKAPGLWSRVAGDTLDLAALSSALSPSNPKRGNVKLALGAVAAIALVDILAARAVTQSARRSSTARQYTDRSGFPRGLRAAKAASVRRQPESSPSFTRA